MFKGYLKTKSAKSHGFIKHKQQMFQEGAVHYTPDRLMLTAKTILSRHFLIHLVDGTTEPILLVAHCGQRCRLVAVIVGIGSCEPQKDPSFLKILFETY
jgi:hypothetical protein